jgi:PKD repeat protein
LREEKNMKKINEGLKGEKDMPIFCTKCGAKLKVNGKFCTECGTQIIEKKHDTIAKKVDTLENKGEPAYESSIQMIKKEPEIEKIELNKKDKELVFNPPSKPKHNPIKIGFKPIIAILIIIALIAISLVCADYLNVVSIGVFANQSPTVLVTSHLSDEYQPSVVSFTIDANDKDGIIKSFVTDFGDGTTSYKMNPTHTYSAGTYKISVAVTDNEGAKAFQNITIVIKNKEPTASSSADITSGIAPLTVSFQGSGTDSDGTINSYHWDFGDGETKTMQNPAHTFKKSGTYIITLTVTDNNGGTSTNMNTITVISNNPPAASVKSSKSNGEAPLTISFSGSGSDTDGTIASYYWDFGDGSTSNEKNPSHKYSTVGTYTVTLTVTDDKGGIGTSILTITANAHTYRWNHVTSFSGIEDRTTETFRISGTKWKIDWSITSSSNYPYFYFYAYSSTSALSVAHQSCSTAPYSDTSYVYEGSGTYYFKIGAANLDDWSISIYQWS